MILQEGTKPIVREEGALEICTSKRGDWKDEPRGGGAGKMHLEHAHV